LNCFFFENAKNVCSLARQTYDGSGSEFERQLLKCFLLVEELTTFTAQYIYRLWLYVSEGKGRT